MQWGCAAHEFHLPNRSSLYWRCCTVVPVTDLLFHWLSDSTVSGKYEACSILWYSLLLAQSSISHWIESRYIDLRLNLRPVLSTKYCTIVLYYLLCCVRICPGPVLYHHTIYVVWLGNAWHDWHWQKKKKFANTQPSGNSIETAEVWYAGDGGAGGI